MFKEARITLTAWYLAIIMTISLSFSAVIYTGINRELIRYEALEQLRQSRSTQINMFLRTNGFPVPPELQEVENESIGAIRARIIWTLGFINASILILAGAGGYFLAGRTLNPIKRNMDEQKEFISNASHELRTPLTSLKTEIEVALRDKKLSAKEAKEFLASNLEDVNKMQKLSNYLLELNRYESGREIPMQKIDLRQVAIKAIGKKKVKSNLKKTIVVGNEDALVEVAAILIDNAFKYGKGKTVEIRTESKSLEVEDHGLGIEKSDLPHIFDRFYRSDKSRGTQGYGLGLSIAKSIVERHGATIKVESEIGKGSTFIVSFM